MHHILFLILIDIFAIIQPSINIVSLTKFHNLLRFFWLLPTVCFGSIFTTGYHVCLLAFLIFHHCHRFQIICRMPFPSNNIFLISLGFWNVKRQPGPTSAHKTKMTNTGCESWSHYSSVCQVSMLYTFIFLPPHCTFGKESQHKQTKLTE